MDGETPGPVGEINPEEVSSTSFPKPEEQPQVVKITPEEIEESKQRDKERVDEILRSLKGEEETELPKVLSTKEVVKSEADAKEHEFYEFNLHSGAPVKVVFKGREETIDTEVFNTDHVVHVGKEPQYLPEEKFKKWKNTFDGRENPRLEYMMQQGRLDQYSKDGGLTMIVDQTSESIMEAALVLGAQDPKVREMFHQARTFQYSDGLLEQIDRAIAAHEFPPDGAGEGLSTSYDPEALLLDSLLGNQEARRTLDSLKVKYDEQYGNDRAEVSKKNEEFVSRPGQKEHFDRQRERLDPMRLEDLVAVHATRFYPTYDDQSGKWKMRTRFDAEGGKTPRTSLHFTMNHVVESHMYGSWDETPYVVVTPMEDLMKENGKPFGLSTVDTYWNLNPGEDLVLPENTWILAPGETKGKQLVKGSSVDNMKHKGPDNSVNKVNYPPPDKSKLRDLKGRLDEDILYSNTEGPEVEEQQQINEQLGEEVEKIAENRNQSVNRLIEALGYEPKLGGDRAWGNSFDVTVQTILLADELGIKAGGHGTSLEAVIETDVMRYYDQISSGGDEDAQGKSLTRLINLNWAKLGEQQRRMLWAMGLV